MQTWIKVVGFFAALTAMVGCAATSTAIAKRNLDVQTRMSKTIFLDPVAPTDRRIIIQVRNTSDKPDFNVEPLIREALVARGYQVTEDPADAHYMLQANVLQVAKSDPKTSEEVLQAGFGGGLIGAVIGAVVEGSGGGTRADINQGGAVGGLVGAAVASVADSAIQDVTYTVITDVQVSERPADGVKITEKQSAELDQGTGSSVTQTSEQMAQWRRFQTRIVSTANKVNLSFEDASPALVQGLTQALSGLF
jgi:hypothetical protein